MQKGQVEMQKGLKQTRQEMRKGMEVTKQEMQKGLEEIKQEMQKGQQGMEKEKIAVVEEKIGKKVEEEIEKISEQVEERIERFTGNFTLISQRMEVLEKKLLAGGNENKNKTNGWTERAKACQLAASLRGEAAEVLQTLPDTERLNLNSLYNALDLRFGQIYSKDYYFVDGLKDGEIQMAVRMADVKGLKSALLYALKVEAATQASCIDRHSIREARGTADEPCES
ncbi:uncharacterized protein TNCV_513941 [Trichonephila clavipes]|nr:uncharacterized protein TNCV_513941 [Trichonephila clavipes]